MADNVIIQFAILIFVNLGLAAVLGFAIGKTRLFEERKGKLSGAAREVIGALIFGILSIIGTATSMNYNGALLNVRDAGPIVGGLWFGPIIGIGAAVMGAIYRFFVGGPTMIPCCTATILAGVVSSLVYVYYRQYITVLTATMLALVLSIVHMFLIMLLTPDGAGYTLILTTPTGIGIMVMVTLSVALFSWCYTLGKGNERPF
jgi:sigma-B regulation protein RsbU (phosphoserine phosphatase)